MGKTYDLKDSGTDQNQNYNYILSFFLSFFLSSFLYFKNYHIYESKYRLWILRFRVISHDFLGHLYHWISKYSMQL